LAAVGLLFHAELRRRWRARLAIAVLISVVGGLVLAATAAGRRTESAFPGFVAAHGFDAVVYATRPVPTIGRLAGVDEVTQVVQPDSGQATCTCARAIAAADLGVEVVSPKAISPFTLISGHLPDPSEPDQVLASFTLQQDYGVRIGTVIHVPFEAPSQAAAYNNPNTGLPKPHGPTVAFHVVGIEATEFEFPSGTTPVYLLYASPAFSRTVLPATAKQYQYYVRLRRGAAGLPGFGVRADALRLGTGSVGYSSGDGHQGPAPLLGGQRAPTRDRRSDRSGCHHHASGRRTRGLAGHGQRVDACRHRADDALPRRLPGFLSRDRRIREPGHWSAGDHRRS
jgi:hypothetical protein